MSFTTPLTLTGPPRRPRQLLDDQSYDGHASVHDEATAGTLGLAGAPIEGPTHLSQVDPLASALWGPRWFETGCVSAHFRTMVVEGEEVTATLATDGGPVARIGATKADGAEVLTGTASVDPDAESELDSRLAASGDPGELFVVDRLEVGQRLESPPATITADDGNGPLYPFSLARKLEAITEPSPWYRSADTPWGRPVLPMEMASVLTQKTGVELPVRGPALGLFLDLEVRLLAGPLFVGQEYALDPRGRGPGPEPPHRVLLGADHGDRHRPRRRRGDGAAPLRRVQGVLRRLPGRSAGLTGIGVGGLVTAPAGEAGDPPGEGGDQQPGAGDGDHHDRPHPGREQVEAGSSRAAARRRR